MPILRHMNSDVFAIHFNVKQNIEKTLMLVWYLYFNYASAAYILSLNLMTFIVFASFFASNRTLSQSSCTSVSLHYTLVICVCVLRS